MKTSINSTWNTFGLEINASEKGQEVLTHPVNIAVTH